MSGAPPRVSVVIPLHNLREFVSDAIECVLDQTLPGDHLEAVVVDDGSTDGGAEVVERYAERHPARVRLVRQENRGLSAARNAGLRVACGAFLIFLDADDLLHPEALAAGLEVFDARPEVGLVYGGVQFVDSAGAPLPQGGWPRLDGDVFSLLVLDNFIAVHQALVRRAPVEAVGGFDESLDAAEDWDLWLRLSRAGLHWACVDRPVALYRMRPAAMHTDPGRMIANRRRVLDNLYATPDLPAEILRLKAQAYHRAYLTGACDHYRVGDRQTGARFFRLAAVAWPAFLVSPGALRLFCGRLLPQGYRARAVMTAEWRRVVKVLFGALADLFAAPDLEPEIARLEWRARLTAWGVLLRLARRRVKAALRGDPLPAARWASPPELRPAWR